MIQEIAPHHYSNTWENIPPQPDDFIIGFRERRVCLKDEQSFFRYRDLPADSACIFLFRIDDQAFFLAEVPETLGILLELNRMRTFQPQTMAFAVLTAWHIHDWLDHNIYCGCCGAKLMPSTTERAMICPDCGHVVYPRIDPAVIVAIVNDKDQLLVTRYAHRTAAHYALVAGYTEVGETVEETVHREVMEETGLKVKDLVYYRSQPWAFSGSVLMGFWCRVDGSGEIRLDHNELAEARWMSREELPDSHDHIALTHDMIRKFKNGFTF
ncbi:MAG: NAD(+) diphosphatase [Solobacterium sp.]|nr:NAD(+) diphosphatase [Solobacterium sp.]MBQ6532359.1 NAD(+) diphosphatase [Solobacterium sp.]MBR0214942.1 NAD(+) diphosphatase [Solobacterium sp.]